MTTWLEKIWDTLIDALLYVWNYIVTGFATMGEALVDALVVKLVAVVPSWNPATIQSYLDAGNYFLPLNETVGMFTLAFSLWVSIWVYRVAKSWIPWVGGN